jgi:hypothetical protein
MLCIPRCGAVRGAARLVRPKITVIIRPKCKHFVLYSNSYLVVLNNYKLQQVFIDEWIPNTAYFTGINGDTLQAGAKTPA